MFLLAFLLVFHFCFTANAVFSTQQKSFLRNEINLAAKEAFPIPKLNFNRSAIDEFIQPIFDCKNVPFGAVSIAVAQLDENDNIQRYIATAYGKTVLNEPNSPSAVESSRFCVGSITKQFTAQLIGKILESKKTFDIKLKELLPESYKFYSQSDPQLAEELTIRDLLAHRTAIPRHDAIWELGLTKPREEIWKNLYHLNPTYGDLAATWRSSFEYNNWMVTLAAYAATILHDPSGKTTWEDLIREFFFKPLQMDSAVFLHDKHEWVIQQLFLRTIPLNAPAGSICLSAVDMVKYIQHLTRTSESPTPAPTRQILHETFMPSQYDASGPLFNNPKYHLFTEDAYGFGWMIGSYGGARQIFHNGGISGYLSYLVVLPDYKAAVYVSTTNDPWNSVSYATQLGLTVIDILMNRTVGHSRCLSHLDPLSYNISLKLNCMFEYSPNLANLLGVYKNPTFDDVNVVYANDTKQIRLYFGSYGTMTLCGYGSDGISTGKFYYKMDTNSTLRVANSDQVLGGFKVIAAPFVFDANRTPGKMTLIPIIIEPRANTAPIYLKDL